MNKKTAKTPDPLRGHKRDGERVRKRLFVETAPAAERSKPRKVSILRWSRILGLSVF